ncbi:MAG: DNA-binding NarL/FixJ family response regulator [Flavobacterium sp.]|jgi:DNA-binding NarL/FixJ family response regulator
MEKIKLILVDDEVLFRKGIAYLLQSEKNIEVVFEAEKGEELINYLRLTHDFPDVILMDLKMPILNGVEATKIINKEFPNLKIIALTSYNTEAFIANIIEVGASTYIVKNATPAKMLLAINKVYEKGFYYDDLVYSVIQKGITQNGGIKSNLDSDFLTKREAEILQLICEQMSSSEIGDKLFISSRTVEGHRNNILLKTGCKNIAGLVVYAIKNKLVALDTISLNNK